MITSSHNRSKVCNFADHFINIFKELKYFCDDGELVDVVLVAGVDNVKVKAHRVILSASSKVFQAMFCGAYKEANSDEIPLDNIDGETLNLLLGFLYSGTIELYSDTVERILKAAHFFQINSLIDVCCDFIADELDPSNCFNICLMANQHNYTALYEKSRRFAYEYFEKVYTGEEFLQVKKEELTEFVFGTKFYITSPQLALQSLVAWIEYDRPNREQFICNLLSHVRFSSLKTQFIYETTESLCKTPECRELVLKWLIWHLDPISRSTFTLGQTEAGINDKLIYATGDRAFQVQTYDPDLGKWSYGEWPRPLNERTDYGMIVVNNKPIIVGGKIGRNVTNTIEWLDLYTGWTELPTMKQARCFPGLAELGGHLYVVGGKNNDSWLQSVEVFDFNLGAWIYSEPLPFSITDIQVAALNGLLYAVGINMIGLKCYNPVTLNWSETTIKDKGTENFGISAVGDYLYLAGTHSKDTGKRTLTIERYDPATNTWTEARLFEFQCSFVRCTTLNDRLIVCRGFDDVGECITVVEEYNPETDKWIALAPLLPHDFTYSSRLFSMQSKS